MPKNKPERPKADQAPRPLSELDKAMRGLIGVPKQDVKMDREAWEKREKKSRD